MPIANIWRQAPRLLALGGSLRVLRYTPSPSKVTQLDSAHLINQHILGLQISVDNASRVHKVYTNKQVVGQCDGLFRRDVRIVHGLLKVALFYV